MSAKTAEDFVNALKANTSLQAEIKAADGGNSGMSAIIDVAKAHGYDISLDDVSEYVRTRRGNLTDDELRRINGGFLGSAIAIIAILIG